MRRAVALGLICGLLGGLACTTAQPGQATLRPTLEVRQVDGGQVAYEQGRPVPTFNRQPFTGISLDGTWRFDGTPVDSSLTFADRTTSVIKGLAAEAGGRLGDTYDDSGWTAIAVPGTFSPPPSSRATGGWYRYRFSVSDAWDTLATLTFQSVGYVADVWLNGRYLGYHEGARTPFALDASDALRPGVVNTLVVRVDNPAWGTRLDIVPWGLADWWNYGGITGPVLLNATPTLSVVRADVTPHLDGADVAVVLQNRGPDAQGLSLITQVLATSVSASNVLSPDPRDLVDSSQSPVASDVSDLDPLAGGAVRRVSVSFTIRGADLWSPARPALYVLRVALLSASGIADQLYDTFGLRQARVDPTGPRVLLNGAPAVFHGVSLHDERQTPPVDGRPAGGLVSTIGDAYAALTRARQVNADLVRADHNPASPPLLMLADRLGFAIWEEVPLYHYTPATFGLAMDRGVPQQLLAEMVLRDFNHPSVLFHGLANESTGAGERASALNTLRDLDRKLDGTRLVGQAAYGSDPADTSGSGLDVAGYTLYSGVFYGGPLDAATIGATLDRFHAAYPNKPILILEFGRWADGTGEEAEQARVFTVTYAALSPRFDTRSGGFVGAAVWWALDDYWTQRPGIQVEHFGLFQPDGSQRQVAGPVATAFAVDQSQAQRPPSNGIRTGGVGVATSRRGAGRQLLGYVLYALAVPAAALGLLVVLLLRWPSRLPWRPA